MLSFAATQVETASVATCAFVEVLTSPASGRPYGYHLKGGFSGPTLAVLGHGANAEAVFDRLLSIHSLRWMHGTLVLLRIDEGLDLLADIERNGGIGPIDRTMVLPLSDVASAQPDRWPHTSVLRFCATLGMIDGRGLPPTPAPLMA